MNPRPINDDISVSEQIAAEDVARIAAAGYRSIICNRPDNEGPDQPSFAQIAAAAKTAGLPSRYIPMAPGQTDPAVAAAQFGEALAELPKPVLAYCRSGARSTMLWQMSQQG